MSKYLPLPVSTLLVAALLVSCGVDGPTDADGRPQVVVTTTILGDVVANVVGDDARVEVLMPIGADPHDFQASSAQIGDLNRSDLVVANGLGLEEGLDDVLDGAADDGVRVFEVGPLLDPLGLAAGDEEHAEDAEHEGEEDHDHGPLDPHVWLDPLRMAEAARLIAGQLAEIEPDIDWTARADRYAGELVATDRMISEQLSAIPEGNRRLVTNHESLGYLASRYDFEVVGVVIPGGSTLADPSSAHLAELVEVMRREALTVIFGETTQPEALAGVVAAELGEEVEVVELFTESLGSSGSGAETLIGMLKTNAELITEALAPGR